MCICKWISVWTQVWLSRGDKSVCTTVRLPATVFAFPVQYIWDLQSPHTASLTLVDKEVTDRVTKSSLFQLVYKNNSLDFKGKKKKKILSKLGWRTSKRSCALIQHWLEWSQPLLWLPGCMYTLEQSSTQTNSSSAADIWLESTWLYQVDSNRFHQRTQHRVIKSNPCSQKCVSS